MSKSDPAFVKQVNIIFHQLEAEMYDVRHPEIMQDEVALWEENVLPIVKTLDVSTALDAGSGTGFVSELLLGHIPHLSKIICYDISEKMLIKARHRLMSKHSSISLAFALGDAEKLPFSDESIELICMNSVLHHLPSYASFLKEVDRVLLRGGVFVLAHEPNRLFFRRITKGIALYDLYRLLRKFETPAEKEEYHRFELFSKTNEYLRREKLIKRDLTSSEIAAIVDFHSPIAGQVDLQRGFVPGELLKTFFPTYRIVALRTYRHLGKVRPKNKLTQLLDRLLTSLFPDRGMLFSWIVMKQEAGGRDLEKEILSSSKCISQCSCKR